MNNTKKDKKKITHFRLSLLDAKTHQQLFSVRFNRTGFFVSAVTIAVVLCAAIFSLIAFTPVRTFIPGYPDARTKRAAIQNAIKVDSLESVIYRWELYSENLRRVVEGEQPQDRSGEGPRFPQEAGFDYEAGSEERRDVRHLKP